MGSLCSKSAQTTNVENDDDNYNDIGEQSQEKVQKEFLRKYGRLDWGCEEPTNKEKAKAGKRYEGHQVLMNLRSSHILNCKVIKVTEQGFLVKPLDLSGFTDSEPEHFDYSKPIPFDRFYHVFLAS